MQRRPVLDCGTFIETIKRGHIRNAGALQNPNADFPRCYPDGEGKNDRRLVTSVNPTAQRIGTSRCCAANLCHTVDDPGSGTNLRTALKWVSRCHSDSSASGAIFLERSMSPRWTGSLNVRMRSSETIWCISRCRAIERLVTGAARIQLTTTAAS